MTCRDWGGVPADGSDEPDPREPLQTEQGAAFNFSGSTTVSGS